MISKNVIMKFVSNQKMKLAQNADAGNRGGGPGTWLERHGQWFD
jgi:hypothetical protein